MRFVGWATTQNGQGEGVRYYDDEATYTATDIGYNVNLILYAQWTDENTPTQQGGSSGTTPGTTLQRAYEIAYTAMHKGMYEEVNPGSSTYQYIDSWNGGQYQGNGRDVRFLIQDMTPEICASATALDSETLVLDIRDQTSYHIIKARDGKCWMQDNLALNIVDSNVQNNISPTNTNANNLAISALLHGGRSEGSQYATSGANYHSPGSKSYSVPLIAIEGNCYNSDCVNDPSEGKWTMNSTINNTPGNGYKKIGIYYNGCAISAATYCYGNGSQGGDIAVDKPNTAIDIEYDICPYGWRLPTGGLLPSSGADIDSGEILAIRDAYPTQPIITEKLSLTTSGYIWVERGKAELQTKEGPFPTSTLMNTGDAKTFGMYVGTYGTIMFNTANPLINLTPVRCIAK
jgi:hypothetical protein